MFLSRACVPTKAKNGFKHFIKPHNSMNKTGLIIKGGLLSALVLLSSLAGLAQQPAEGSSEAGDPRRPAREAGGAQEQYRFSRRECVRYALQHNQQMKEATFDIRKNAKEVKEVLARAYPQVNASADLNYYIERPTQVIPSDGFLPPGLSEQFPQLQPEGDFIESQFGLPYNANAGLEIQQLLFDGTFFLGVKASKELVKLSKMQEDRSEVQVVADVSKAYYTVLVANKKLEQLEANLARLQKLQRDTKLMKEEGFAESLDVDRLDVQLNNLKTKLRNARRQAQLSKQVLKFQMGMHPKAQLALTDPVKPEALETMQVDTTGEINPNQRPAYRLLQQQYYMKGLNKKRYLNAYFPKAFAFGNLRAQAYRQEFDFLTGRRWYPASQVGIQVEVPIFTGFQRSARIQQAEIERERVASRIENFERSMALEVERARTELKNSLANYRNQERNLELAQKVYDKTKLKYEEGIGSSLEVKEAESELSTAQANYTDAMLQVYMARVELRRATGQLQVPGNTEPMLEPTRE
jgi:outer membrane protein TolC